MKSAKAIAIFIGVIIVIVLIIGILAVANRDDEEQVTDNGQTSQNGNGEESPDLAELAASKFNDVSPDADYAAAVGWLVDNNLTSGCSEGMFCSDAEIPRWQFVTLLWRASGSPEPAKPGSEIFQDVEAGSTADKAVGWADEQGITSGCRTDADGSRFFCSGETTSRSNAASFLYRYVGSDYENDQQVFADVAADASYANAAKWLAEYKVDRGCGEGNFCPGDPLTRGQAAVLIYGVAEQPDSWGTDDSFSGLSSDTTPQ